MKKTCDKVCNHKKTCVQIFNENIKKCSNNRIKLCTELEQFRQKYIGAHECDKCLDVPFLNNLPNEVNAEKDVIRETEDLHTEKGTQKSASIQTITEKCYVISITLCIITGIVLILLLFYKLSNNSTTNKEYSR